MRIIGFIICMALMLIINRALGFSVEASSFGMMIGAGVYILLNLGS